MRVISIAIALCLAAFGSPHVNAAEGQPIPPCAGPSHPSYPAFDGSPNIGVWYADDLGEKWLPPACVGWEIGKLDLVLAVASRFYHASGATGLLERVAAISALETVRYWSVTRKRWRELVTEAYALEGPDRWLRRPDFSVDELQPGHDLYFWQDVNTPASTGVYRLRIRERSPHRVVLELENFEAMDFLSLYVLGPGQYRTLFFLDQDTETVWRYYSLTRVGAVVGPLARTGEASYVNRAVAIYRHFAGLPTDQESPAAP